MREGAVLRDLVVGDEEVLPGVFADGGGSFAPDSGGAGRPRSDLIFSITNS